MTKVKKLVQGNSWLSFKNQWLNAIFSKPNFFFFINSIIILPCSYVVVPKSKATSLTECPGGEYNEKSFF